MNSMLWPTISFNETLRIVARFCRRLGFGDDIESAEAKRSRRMGLRRATRFAFLDIFWVANLHWCLHVGFW